VLILFDPIKLFVFILKQINTENSYIRIQRNSQFFKEIYKNKHFRISKKKILIQVNFHRGFSQFLRKLKKT